MSQQHQQPSKQIIDVSRRNVIKATAAVAAVTAMGTNFAYAAGSDKIKVGLIGCGGRGRGAAANCVDGAENVQIKAVGDVFERQAKGAAGEFGKRDKEKYDVGDRIFSGLDAYKGVIDSGVDMVILATPPGFRPYHFKAAVEAGKHVFMEKPIAVDPTGVRLVMEVGKLAAEKKLGVVAGTQRRHQKGYVETVKRIHDGAIGEILHMSVYWNGGGIWSRKREPGMSDVEYQINNWYHYIWLCGDHINEQHIHNLDVANWVMNSHPISAYGQGGRQVRRDTPGQIWDNFAIEYEYPNGARVLSFCRHWGQSDDNISEWAIGSNGVSNPASYVQPKGDKRINAGGGGRNPYEQEHTDLVASIRAGSPLNEAQQVAESTLTAVMGRMSAYTGRKIYWDQSVAPKGDKAAPTAMESKLDTMPKNLDLKGSLPEPPVPMPDKEEPV
jgi:myo-inositol 2-dehydrogenase / D-chiro-inositol 1-dehydrogenase